MDKLRAELRGYTDQETTLVEEKVSQKIDVLKDQLVTEQERLRSEFETFRNKDFKDLEARVAALEKKYQRLQEIINNLNIPQAAGGGGVSQEAFDALVIRVD